MTPSGAWVPAVVAGRTGIGLSQRMQSFVLDEAENPYNVVAPGKRPRVTLTPSLALKDGRPHLAFAVQGGDTQDQNLLQFFLNVVEFGMNVQQAAEAANITSHQMRSSFGAHESRPGHLTLTDSTPPWVRGELRGDGLRAGVRADHLRARSTPSSSTGRTARCGAARAITARTTGSPGSGGRRRCPTCDSARPRDRRRSSRCARDRLLVGRSRDCDLILPDVLLSRRHAELYRAARGWLVRDLGSMNGTRVNERADRATSASLYDGDVVGVAGWRSPSSSGRPSGRRPSRSDHAARGPRHHLPRHEVRARPRRPHPPEPHPRGPHARRGRGRRRRRRRRAPRHAPRPPARRRSPPGAGAVACLEGDPPVPAVVAVAPGRGRGPGDDRPRGGGAGPAAAGRLCSRLACPPRTSTVRSVLCAPLWFTGPGEGSERMVGLVWSSRRRPSRPRSCAEHLELVSAIVNLAASRLESAASAGGDRRQAPARGGPPRGRAHPGQPASRGGALPRRAGTSEARAGSAARWAPTTTTSPSNAASCSSPSATWPARAWPRRSSWPRSGRRCARSGRSRSRCPDLSPASTRTCSRPCPPNRYATLVLARLAAGHRRVPLRQRRARGAGARPGRRSGRAARAGRHDPRRPSRRRPGTRVGRSLAPGDTLVGLSDGVVGGAGTGLTPEAVAAEIRRAGAARRPRDPGSLFNRRRRPLSAPSGTTTTTPSSS